MLHLAKLLALFAIVIATAALLALPSNDAAAMAQCQPGCEPMYARCMRRNHNVDVCRDFVCDYYGDKVVHQSLVSHQMRHKTDEEAVYKL